MALYICAKKLEDKKIHHIAHNLVIHSNGCTVICHGVVRSASHLNGELGKVRNMKQDETGIRLWVHFEKFKPEKLRIVFYLPS
jgi:hypothetical protein